MDIKISKKKYKKNGFKVLTSRPRIYTFTGQSYYRAKLREGYITAERY
jgi:hypothetical protein